MNLKVLLCLLGFPVGAYAMDSSPVDWTFGGSLSGIYVFSADTSPLQVHNLVLDKKGRIVTSGLSGSEPYASRHTSDGVYDFTFNRGGIVVSQSFAGFGATDGALAVDQQSRVVTAGSVSLPIACDSSTPNSNYAYVSRFNEDASWDTNFGATGFPGHTFFRLEDCDDAYTVTDLVADANDGILIAGLGSNGHDFFAVASHFLSSGSVDDAFGNHGLVTVSDFRDMSDVRAAIDSRGRFLVTANHRSTSISSHQEGLIYRFLADGTPDTTFGDKGSIAFDFGFVGEICCLKIDSVNRVLLAGTHGSVEGDTIKRSAFVVRVSEQGVLDDRFGDGGIVDLPAVGNNAEGMSLVVDDRNRPLLAIKNDYLASSDIVVANLNADGSYNNAVGVGGIYETALGLFWSLPISMIIDAYGRPTLAIHSSDVEKGVLVRYDALFGDGFD